MNERPHPSNPIRALLTRGSVYGLATALQLSSSLLVLPALTRLLSPADFGVVAVATVVQMVLTLTGALGLPETLPRTFFRSADGPTRARGLVSTSLALALAVAILAELSGPFWAPLLDLEYGLPLRLAVWSSVPYAALLTAQAILRAADRPGRFLVTAFLATAGAQGLGLALAGAGDAGASGYLGGLAVGIAVGALVAVASTGASASGIRDLDFVRSQLRVSLPTVAHGLGLYFLWAGDRIVLTALEDTAAAGRYHVAYLVGGLTILFVSAVYNAWVPIVFGAPEARRWAVLAETTDALYKVASLTAAVCAVGAPVALLALAPSEYDPLELVPVSSLVALAVLPFVAYCATVHVLIWHGHTLTLAWVTPLVAVVNVVLNIALVPALDLAGAAIATVASYTLEAGLVGMAAWRITRVPWRARGALEALLLTGAAVAGGALAPSEGGWLALRLVVVVGLLAWLAAIVVRLRRAAPAVATP